MQSKLSKAVLSGALAVGLIAGPMIAIPAAADTAGQSSRSDLAVTTAVEGCEVPNFADNSDSASAFFRAVRWMQCEGVSVGYSTDNTFRKARNVSRGETAAFLHRMVEPDVEAPAQSPFDDVNADGSFYEPITWAESEGITAGQADGDFGASKSVTRGQFAAFLFGLEDPEYTGPRESPFEDLKVNGANFRAIAWLSENGIAVGDTDGNFNQSDSITRGQISAMLHAYAQFKERRDGGGNGSTSIEIYSFNDFHGALSEDYAGTLFAHTVEEQRSEFEAEHGEGSTLLTSAGDLIGASASVSNVQQDEPTIQIMNALGLAVSAAGNHEFDKGLDDLTGRVAELAEFEFLAANFVDPETREPVLPAYDIHEVNGVRVAVIGAVPNNLYATTTGSGLEGNLVIDLVEGVNTVAEELSDGVEEEGNDEADVIVASYHDGAPGSGELAEETADSELFDAIVNETDESVDVIFNGHTHQAYDYDTEVNGQARPVLQAGQSGNLLATVELELDAETHEVLGYEAELVERTATPVTGEGDAEETDFAAIEELAATNPVVQEVYELERTAVEEFEELQSTVIGQIGASITTDYPVLLENGKPWKAGGTRSAETTLGNWAADALKDRVSLSNEDVDLGVTNAGGLRSELLYDEFTASGQFTDKPADLVGEVTLGEVLDFAPFGNTLVYFDIPGSSIKQVIEENWHDGEKALHLAWSEELTYTYDESREQGDKVTGIWIDGEPLDMDQMYTVATLSFLGDTSWVGTENSAPDGYEGFAQGMENFVDLGIMDNQAFQEYIAAQSAGQGQIRPDFAKKAVEVTGAPAEVTAGAEISLTLDNLEMESVGAGDAVSVLVEFEDADGERVELGTVEVPAEGESVTLTGINAPDVAGEGELVMTVTYDDEYASSTEVRHQLTVTDPAAG